MEFIWSEECQTAFETLRNKLVDAPILAKAIVGEPFILTTGASQTHVGAVLGQKRDGKEVAIGYFSKKLKPAEKSYSVTDREALGVVLACRNFSHFLWGTKFTI